MNEKRIRSLTKGVIWRIVSIFLLASITYIFTKNIITVTLVTFVSNTIFLIYFYIHERIWLRIKRPKSLAKRSILKMFTYITLGATLVLIPVTYVFTKSLDKTIEITLIYAILKHIIYIINEFVWNKHIKWGVKEDNKRDEK